MWFSVVLLGYSHELSAFHVGLFLKPNYLLNSLETDPLIIFTLTHRDRVKIKNLNFNATAGVLVPKKKDYPCLQNDEQKLSLFLSLMGPQNYPVPQAHDRSLKTYSMASSPGAL